MIVIVTSIISGERSISYPDIHVRIARAATGLRSLGLRDGVPVAMMLRNDFALFEVMIELTIRVLNEGG